MSENPKTNKKSRLEGVDDLLKRLDELTKPRKSDHVVMSSAKSTKKSSSSVKFYWQYIEQEDVPTTVFAITPKEFFDVEGCLSDEHFDEDGIPKGFSNLMESQFEFDGTRKEGEAILRANPLFEEKEMSP